MSTPDLPVNYESASSYGDVDTYVGYDTETGVYYDIFGKTLTEDEVDARRELITKILSNAV